MHSPRLSRLVRAACAFASVPLFAASALAQYNYSEALQKALYFYEIQRSGVKAADSRVEWKSNSHVNDGSQAPWGAVDLSGGWYDAGDTVKWNQTMAFAAIHQAWSAIEYPSAYTSSGQVPYLVRNLRHVNAYYKRCFTATDPNNVSTYRIVTQVVPDEGSAYTDHNYWAAAEVAEIMNTDRKVRYATPSAPDTTIVADVAAAVAASSIVLRTHGTAAEADELLLLAERMFNFADTYRGYTFNLPDGSIGGSTPDQPYMLDDLCQAAIWLHRAQKAKTASYPDTYLNKAIVFEQTQYFHSNYVTPGYAAYNLCNLVHLSQLVPATTAYRVKCEQSMDFYTYQAVKVGGGMSWFNTYDWGVLRQANNAAFTTLVYADTVATGTKKTDYTAWAKSQLDFALGSNNANVSFVGGFVPAGKSEIDRIHHRTGHGSWAGFDYFQADWRQQLTLRHKLYGAMVGGPSSDGAWPPGANEGYSVGNSNNLEVALDYNSGFTASLARMVAKGQGSGTVLANFPAVENRDHEFVSRAMWHSPGYANGTSVYTVELDLENHTAWPARSIGQLSQRYYFTLEAGTSLNDIEMVNQYDPTATITGPFSYSGNVGYFEIRPAATAPLSPTSADNSRRGYYLKLQNKNGVAVDKTNDWSYPGATRIVTENIPIYDNGKRVFGTEPDNLPAVGLKLARAWAQEGTQDTGAWSVVRTGSAAAALTVNYTVSGTAVAGTHYTALPGSVTLAAGVRSAGIYVAPGTLDVNRTVIVTLAANAAYAITDASGTVTLADNGGAAPPSGSQPYGGSPVALPGVIEAENYDTGGQGVAYNDNDTSNNGGAYRPSEGVDLEACNEGGYGVGWTNPGEWLHYTVSVATAGSYNFTYRAASQPGGGSITLSVDGNTVSGDTVVNATGGWQSWTDLTKTGVTLSAGTHLIRVGFGSGNVNLHRITVAAAVAAPVVTSATSASGTVGTAFSYTITASNSPTSYSASGLPGGLSINTSSGVISGTPTAAGASSVTLGATNGGGTGTANLSLSIAAAPPSGSQPYGGSPVALPGVIELENYDTGGEGVAYSDADTSNNGSGFRTTEGVDLEATSEGGYGIGWTNPGEWTHYTVSVATAGTYDFTFRVASQSGGGSLRLAVDGAAVAGDLTIPSTGGWQTWVNATKTGVTLSAGTHLLRVTSLAGGYNLHRATVTAVSPAPTASNDSATTNEETATDINVRANDTGTSITVTGLTTPANGSVAVVSGNARYTPRAGFFGSDSFGYTITDNQSRTAGATVNVTVNNTATAQNLTGSSAALTGANLGSGTGGSRVLVGGAWEVTGRGAGFAGTADAAHIEGRSYTGNFEIVARVTALATGTAPRAGVYLRETTTNRMAYAAVGTGSSFYAGARLTNNGTASATTVSSPALAFPAGWVRLQRSGDTVKASFSTNGTTWSGTQTYTLGSLTSALNIGLFATSGDGSATARATFASADYLLFALPPTTNLLAHWFLDEGTGTTSADDSGAARTVTLGSGVSWATGYEGSSLDFTNAGASASFNLPSATAVTLSAWIKPRSSGYSTVAGALGRVFETQGFMVYLVDAGSGPLVRFAQRRATASSYWDTNVNVVAYNQWKHVAVTFDSATSNPPVIYIDGVAVTVTLNTAGSGAQRDNNGVAYLGNSAASDRGFNGVIDDPRVYSRVLTAAEALTLP